MKAERRQELRTNELAQAIEDSREFFRVWGSYILGGVVILVLVVAFAVYRTKAADEQLTESWKSLQTVSFFDAKGEKKSDEEINTSFARLQDLAAENRGPDFLLEVLSIQAQSAMRLAGASKEGVVDARWLDKARDAYEGMRTRLPENPLAVALALNGLAVIEANQFVVDGDPSRKAKARELLEKLKDDPRFTGTPFQRAALERINKLDDVFQRVEFAAAPPPPPGVVELNTTTAPATPEALTPILPPPAATVPPEGESSPAEPPPAPTPAEAEPPAPDPAAPDGAAEESPPPPTSDNDATGSP